MSEALTTPSNQKPSPRHSMEDGRQSKRKRVAQACCICQTKKIRCDGKLPACTYCLDHNLECTFSRSQKRRGPRNCATEMNNFEQRLVRMESLLDNSRSMANASNDITSPNVSEAPLEDASSNSIAATSSNLPQAPMTVVSCTPGSSRPPMIGETGTMLEDARQSRVGSWMPDLSHLDRSNRSIDIGDGDDEEMEFSPPVRWIIEKADDSSAIKGSFAQAGLFDPMNPAKGTNILSTGLKRPVYAPLPPKEEVVRLVEVFFHGYNRFFPLFDPRSFMSLVEQQYSDQPDNRVGWWASLNSVIAIGIRLQGSKHGGKDATGQALAYMHNAFGVLTELMIRGTDLLSMQALISLAVFVQGNGEPQATAMLVTSALKLSQILGLQRNKLSADNDPVIARQSRRAFWIACRMDRELSIVSKLPLTQDAADINVDLPVEDPPDGLGDVDHSEGSGKVNIFRLIIELSVIEAEVNQRLYTTKACQQSEEELVHTIVQLDQQLEEWKIGVPIDFQPEYEIKTSDFYLRQHIIILHFTYYNCLSNIHYACMSLAKSRQMSAESRNFSYLVDSQITLSRALCMSAARAMIRLTRYISEEPPCFVWRILCYPILATITLFVSIRDEPTRPRALTDITLLGSMVNFLSRMEEMDIRAIHQIRRVCSELERVARETADRAQSDLNRQKLQSQQSIDRYSENSSGPRSSRSSVAFGQQKGVPVYGGIDSSRVATALSSQSFGDTLTNGYLDPQAIFTSSMPVWNSDSLHEDLLAEIFPQSYGQLDMQPGL